MKLNRLWVLILALALVPLAFAQDQDKDQQEGPHHGGRHGMMHGGMNDPDQHLQMLTKQLNLTSDQQEKIRPILQDQHTKMQQWMQNNQNASQADRRAQMQQMHNDTVSQIKAVLNPDQQAKFDKMQQNMMEHRHGKGHNHGGMDKDDNGPKS